jgi:hypothetical protein
MGFRFELVSSEGDTLDSIETNEANWQAGDTVIGRRNTRYTAVSVIPLAKVEEFVVIIPPMRVVISSMVLRAYLMVLPAPPTALSERFVTGLAFLRLRRQLRVVDGERLDAPAR